MRVLPCVAAIMLCPAGLLVGQTTEPVVVDAIVCQPDGRPLAGVRFGDAWGLLEGRWEPGFICTHPDHPLVLTSDAEGRIRGTWIWSPTLAPLFGLSADGSMAAFVLPVSDHGEKPVHVPERIVLERTVRVRGRMRGAADAVKDAVCYLTWTERNDWGLPGGIHFGLRDAAFELPLPPKRYEFRAHCRYGGSQWASANPRTIVLTPGQTTFDLGPVTLQLGPLALIGEVLPDWHVDVAWKPGGPPPTTASALENTNLADFRGKPLLVQFGDFAQVPKEAWAALTGLANHPHAESFAVVLFSIAKAGWPPPGGSPVIQQVLPMFWDTTGATAASYDVRWATIVLDADGRLVCCGGIEEAMAALETLLPAGGTGSGMGRGKGLGNAK
jgi:hypothetical protein